MIIGKPLSSSEISISWQEPKFPNGRIQSYQIYVKEAVLQQKTSTLIRLLVKPGETSKLFAHNITQLSKKT